MALPADVAALLEQALGVKSSAPPPPSLDQVRLPSSALDPLVSAELAAAVGDENVRDSVEDRIRHTRGKSTVDLLRLRSGDGVDAPDAVVLPAVTTTYWLCSKSAPGIGSRSCHSVAAPRSLAVSRRPGPVSPA
jgi:hypothetical protein